MKMKRCPVCDGEGALLGGLGLLMWWRCRDCGMEFNTKVRRRRKALTTES